MFSRLAFLAVFLCSPVFATEPFSLGVGTHYLRITVAPDGTFAVQPITPILLAGSSPVPNPDPRPQPDPTLTDRGRAIQAAARAVTGDAARDETALILAAAYRQIGEQITAGKIKGQAQISFALKTAADLILLQRRAAQPWQPVRELLGKYVTDLAQQGKPDGDYAALCSEAADGLGASVTRPQAIDIEMIIRLIQLILELIDRLQPR